MKLVLSFVLLVQFAVNAIEPKLIAALIQVESSGRDHVTGAGGKAIGALQIHVEMVHDVNRLCGTSYTHKEMSDRAKAVDVCKKYLAYYGSEKRLGKKPTLQDYARIWNGGPSGWKRKATQGYWAKVRRHL